MKKTLISLSLAITLLLSPLVQFPATAIPSDWAANEVELAFQWGLVNPDLLFNVTSQDALTKDMLCEMVVILCEKLLKTTISADYSVEFEDEWYIPVHFYKAYTAGIVSGKGIAPEGKIILGKTDELNREAVFTMMYNAIVYCYPAEAVDTSETDDILSAFSDREQVSSWARMPAAYMSRQGIVRGFDGRYMPKESCTVEQGIITVKRIYEAFSDSTDRQDSPLLTLNLDAPELTSPLSGSSHDIQNGVILHWNPVVGASGYRLRLMSDWGMLDHFVYQPTASLDAWMLTTGTNTISLTAIDGSGQVISQPTRFTLEITGERLEFPSVSTRLAEDYVFDFTSMEEAMQYMTTVTIPVWRINSNGAKYATTTQVTVHRYVAGDVITIFNEIFQGPEKFPIRSIGGFAWRSGRGEHPTGTAVDINPTQNYQIFPDGRIGSGTHWKPGEDPYSIPIGGDVERAFRRLGWGWGGVDWSSNNDYMHFSFFGT